MCTVKCDVADDVDRSSGRERAPSARRPGLAPSSRAATRPHAPQGAAGPPRPRGKQDQGREFPVVRRATPLRPPSTALAGGQRASPTRMPWAALRPAPGRDGPQRDLRRVLSRSTKTSSWSVRGLAVSQVRRCILRRRHASRTPISRTQHQPISGMLCIRRLRLCESQRTIGQEPTNL